MSNLPAEIPGFYFDPEKRKYFRLLPSHAAPLSRTNFYTPASIAARESERAKKARETHQAFLDSQIRRRPLLTASAYLHCTLARELGVGARTSWRVAAMKTWAAALRRKPLFSVNTDESRISNLFCERIGSQLHFVLGFADGRVVSFVADDQSEAGVEVCQLTALVWSTRLPGPITGTLAYQIADRVEILVSSQSPTYALHIPEPATISRYNTHDGRPTLCTVASRTHTFSGLEGGVCISAPHDYPRAAAKPHSTSTDVFAADAILNHAATPTFLAGGNDGLVRLFDVREAPHESSVVLRTSSVRGIKSLDTNRVIVRCVDSCAAYDLRMPQTASPSIKFSKSRWVGEFCLPGRGASGDGRKGGFDVALDAGLLAVEARGEVCLFDVESGERVGCVQGTEAGAVRFLEQKGGSGWPGIVVVGKCGVGVYQW